jgi:hypothetical protein
MSGHPVLGLTGHGDQCFQVVETERGPVAPFASLILERPRERRGEEGTLLAGIPLDRLIDVAASQLVGWLF